MSDEENDNLFVWKLCGFCARSLNLPKMRDLLALALIAVCGDAHVFGRQEGLRGVLVDAAQAAAGAVSADPICPEFKGSFTRCCLMYLDSPTTVIGKTWGLLPEHQQKEWGHLRCDRFGGRMKLARQNGFLRSAAALRASPAGADVRQWCLSVADAHAMESSNGVRALPRALRADWGRLGCDAVWKEAKALAARPLGMPLLEAHDAFGTRGGATTRLADLAAAGKMRATHVSGAPFDSSGRRKEASDRTAFLLDAWAIDAKIAADSSWAPCCAMLRSRPSLQAASDGFLDQGSGVLTAAAWQQLGCSKFRPSRFSVNNSPLCTAKRRTANCTAHLSHAPPQVGSAPQRVPRTIHQIWVGSSMPLFKQKLTGAAKKLACAHGWRYRLWGDADIATGYFKLTGPLIAETRKGGEWASMADLMRVEIIYREGGVYLDTNVELLRDLTGVVEAAEARAAAASKAHVFIGCNELQGLFTFTAGQYLSNGVFAASAKNPAVRLVIGRQARARIRQQRAAHAKANRATGPWHLGWSMVRAHNDTRIRSAVEFVILRAIAFFPFTAWNAIDPCGTKMSTFKHPDRCYYQRRRALKEGQEKLHDPRSGKTLAFPCDRDVYPHSLGVDHVELGGSWL